MLLEINMLLNFLIYVKIFDKNLVDCRNYY